MPTVHIPGVGDVERRHVIIAAAVAAGIVGYAWWQRSHGATAAAGGAQGVTVDPTTGSLDGTGVYQNPAPVGGSTIPAPSTGGGMTTNAQWSQAVAAYLAAYYDGDFIVQTLGKYLAKVPLTTDEATLIQTAWAFEGFPPQGPNTFTLTTTGPHPGGGGGGGGHKPPPPPPPPTAEYVTTAQFHTPNPPWNSTLSGIASVKHTTVEAIMALNPTIYPAHSRDYVPYPGRLRVK